jgi:acetyl-CoA carboxylase biotin carboxyl carrier protein
LTPTRAPLATRSFSSARGIGFRGGAPVACPAEMANVIRAHITGTVWKIQVAVGDAVQEGTEVAILESMKMEMPVESEDAGIVKAILVVEGQAITEGAPIVELE